MAAGVGADEFGKISAELEVERGGESRAIDGEGNAGAVRQLERRLGHRRAHFEMKRRTGSFDGLDVGVVLCGRRLAGVVREQDFGGRGDELGGIHAFHGAFRGHAVAGLDAECERVFRCGQRRFITTAAERIHREGKLASFRS